MCCILLLNQIYIVKDCSLKNCVLLVKPNLSNQTVKKPLLLLSLCLFGERWDEKALSNVFEKSYGCRGEIQRRVFNPFTAINVLEILNQSLLFGPSLPFKNHVLSYFFKNFLLWLCIFLNIVKFSIFMVPVPFVLIFPI